MFTGIIEAVSAVTKIEKRGSECRLSIKNPFGNEIKTGDSIAVDGVCLTVESFTEGTISFFVSKSTLEKTIAAKYNTGSTVNLERAMPADGRFDGHIVQGHVDSCGKITGVRKIGDGVETEITFDRKFNDLTVPRGSVTVNGVSLTIAGLEGNTLKISLIPETLKRTSFAGTLKTGAEVNIEFDILGKYVARIMHRGGNDEALENLIEKL
ncbi:riboflavin synthase [bacterium]|nr:riboflavin synthase [bacterium]